MPRLFDRDWTVTIGTARVSRPIDLSFSVEKTASAEPNTLTLHVLNLSDETRRAIVEAGKGTPVRLEAGYVTGKSVIFLGEVRKAHIERTGPDLALVVEAAEGAQAYLSARVNRAYPPGARVATVIRDLVTALGVGAGNSADVAPADTYARGAVVSGSAARELTGVLRSYGLRWSIQNGTLQVQGTTRSTANHPESREAFLAAWRAQIAALPVAQRPAEQARLDRFIRQNTVTTTVTATSVVLNTETGLVGTPEVDADGTAKVTMLMIPDVYPGRTLRVESTTLTGSYRIERCTYTGDTAAQPWYIEAQCLPVSPRT